jgi:pimeloyl-ACP methyl ester carboxylesterase
VESVNQKPLYAKVIHPALKLFPHSYTLKTSATMSLNSTVSQLQLRDGRQLSYQISGPAPKPSSSGPSDSIPTVLLSNSLCAPFHTWDHYVSILHGHKFRVIQYDQVGHGGSTVNSSEVDGTTFNSLANDVLQLLDALQVRKVHAWIGISMGAATGIYFCAQNPGRVERLVICDTISCSPNAIGIPDPFEARVAAARKDGHINDIVEQTIVRWFSEPWREMNEAEVQRMRNIMLKTQIEGFAACCRALQDKEFDLRPLAGKLGGAVEKVMLVVGENDANLPQTMAELREQIQAGFDSLGKGGKVRWAIIKGAGHVSVVDGLEEYSQHVTQFLEA